jgi:hypothetical protein
LSRRAGGTTFDLVRMKPTRATILCLALLCLVLSACGSVNAIPGGDGDAGDPPGSPSRGQGASPSLAGMTSPPADTDDAPPASSGMFTRAPDAGAPEEPPAVIMPIADAGARDAAPAQDAAPARDAATDRDAGAPADAGAHDALAAIDASDAKDASDARLSEPPPSKPCPTDQERCGAACVKVGEDRANCGACGRACAGNQLCVKGTCQCKDDQLLCGLLCIAPKSDVLNCGGCGILCLGKKCHDGKCEGG